MALGKGFEIIAGILRDFPKVIKECGFSKLMEEIVQKVKYNGLSGFVTTCTSPYHEEVVK